MKYRACAKFFCVELNQVVRPGQTVELTEEQAAKYRYEVLPFADTMGEVPQTRFISREIRSSRRFPTSGVTDRGISDRRSYDRSRSGYG